jgi:hypothetical protein
MIGVANGFNARVLRGAEIDTAELDITLMTFVTGTSLLLLTTTGSLGLVVNGGGLALVEATDELFADGTIDPLTLLVVECVPLRFGSENGNEAVDETFAGLDVGLNHVTLAELVVE